MTAPHNIVQPPSWLCGFFDDLRARGFDVAPTRSNRSDVRNIKVWRIWWRFEYVAQAEPALWDLNRPLLYRFMPWERARPAFACPPHFDTATFARERGCAPEALEVVPNADGNSYLHVKTLDAALKVLDHSARRLDQMFPA